MRWTRGRKARRQCGKTSPVGEKRGRQGRKLTRAKGGKKAVGKLLRSNRVRGKARLAGGSWVKLRVRMRSVAWGITTSNSRFEYI